MPAFPKNSRPGRRIAAVAAAVVLAGSVQLLTAGSSWACGAPANAKAAAPGTAKAAPGNDAPVHRGGIEAGFHMTPVDLTIKAGGPGLELGTSVANFTGAPYRNAVPSLAVSAVFAGEGGTRYLADKYLTVEYSHTGGWQKLPLVRGCDPTLFATPAKGIPVENGRAQHATFRVTLSADAPADLRTLRIGLSAEAEDKKHSDWAYREARVTVPKPAKPAPTAKPTTGPTTPKTTAKPTAKPAAPVAEATPAPTAKPTTTTAPAPAEPTTAPATTAPAGTPELAQTGADTPNG
ncbi:hypothetical protein ACFCX4_28445, partial [Kitasatospora sp. NPDC056327]|uniref:hypothetical protein n=1 Tax=Kitasatospora sp. NPDC056327 TaxID=3345785 RepID=UPI0035E0B093